MERFSGQNEMMTSFCCAILKLFDSHTLFTDIFPILQLDLNLSNGSSSEQEIKEAFIEFYKLFDDFGIIDKTRYENINNWYEPEHHMKT